MKRKTQTKKEKVRRGEEVSADQKWRGKARPKKWRGKPRPKMERQAQIKNRAASPDQKNEGSLLFHVTSRRSGNSGIRMSIDKPTTLNTTEGIIGPK